MGSFGNSGIRGLGIEPRPLAERLCVDFAESFPYRTPLNAADVDADAELDRALSELHKRLDFNDAPVALTASSDTTLVRQVTLPPIMDDKAAIIVAYEAKQMIPFPLEQVVWRWLDLSRLSGDTTPAPLNRKVVLVAKKQESACSELNLLEKHGIEVELVQSSVLVLANLLWSAEQAQREGETGFDLILDVGASRTTLVISDGNTFWSRTIPIGGGLFTKALSKELKFTWAKAEELKQGAVDKKSIETVLKATRSVLADFITELRRSLGFFLSVDRGVKFRTLRIFGGSSLIPGLKEALENATDLQAEEPYWGDRIEGQFPDANIPFGGCHLALGAALERLGIGKFRVNLHPDMPTLSPEFSSAWGIDVGTHALKVLRLSRID